MFAGEPVYALARVDGPDDRYGKPSYTWPGPGVEVPGVLVAPGKSTEGNETIRQQVDTSCTLYLPASAAAVPMTRHDRVVVRGRTWSVEGDRAVWSSGSWAAGSVLELTTVEG